ncbi:MAG: 30S ribosomal protein S24e, partial [Methanobrevibacter sp.]|nr:30S ribosomal protein S24e [Methanobrevibacter sp.]
PKVLDIKSKLVALLNTKKELIVVDNVQPHYGEPKALGYAKVYDTAEDLAYIETEHVIAKNAEPEEEASEEDAEAEE